MAEILLRIAEFLKKSEIYKTCHTVIYLFFKTLSIVCSRSCILKFYLEKKKIWYVGGNWLQYALFISRLKKKTRQLNV